jgi:anti-anti-sigma factor
MPIHRWSDRIAIVQFGDEPQFSEDATSVERLLDSEEGLEPDVVFDLGGVSHLNSSNMAQMLKLRKRLARVGRSVRLCSVRDSVWGVLMTAGLDKLFHCAPDVATALASLQLER